MINISSVPDVSYAYLATLTRLDANGDGVLSRTERAAEEKPGIIREFLEDDDSSDPQTNYQSNLAALMMEFRGNGSATGATVPYALQQIVLEAEDQATLAYRNTYGEFDLDIAA